MSAWAGPLIIAAAAVAMLAWSWGKWPDPLVDFGRELYVPWRLAGGDVLYRDVAYFNGPLSPYLNALWFKLFGVGLWTLAAANIALAAVLLVLTYALLARIADRLAATIACLLFVGIFGFGQLVEVGNYNYVCPYSHELTHGIVLAFAALSALLRFGRSRNVAWLLGAGAATGLAFLTKPEVFAALAPAVLAGFTAVERVQPGRRTIRGLILLCAAALAPVIVAWLLLAWPLGPARAFTGVLGGWTTALDADVRNLGFYRDSLGLTGMGENIRIMLLWAGAIVGLLSAAAAAGVVLRARRRAAVLVGMTMAALAAFFLTYRFQPEGGQAVGFTLWKLPWQHAARPLPLFMTAVAVACAVEAWRFRRRGDSSPIPGLRLAIAVFALGMLGKMILRAQVFHYGFALAMPAALVFPCAALSWGPQWLQAGARMGPIRFAPLQIVTACLLLLFAAVCLERNSRSFASKSTSVGDGRDWFLAGRAGPFVNEAVRRIRERVAPDQTLAVMPEGVMINYLARLRNPTPYINFMPLELAIFGEDPMIDALRSSPPDFLVLVHKDTSEYGYRFFGQDYGRRFWSWIENHYRPLGRPIGATPFTGPAFGIMLLERRGDL